MASVAIEEIQLIWTVQCVSEPVTEAPQDADAAPQLPSVEAAVQPEIPVARPDLGVRKPGLCDRLEVIA
jgi:hypothetical protein